MVSGQLPVDELEGIRTTPSQPRSFTWELCGLEQLTSILVPRPMSLVETEVTLVTSSWQGCVRSK